MGIEKSDSKSETRDAVVAGSFSFEVEIRYAKEEKGGRPSLYYRGMIVNLGSAVIEDMLDLKADIDDLRAPIGENVQADPDSAHTIPIQTTAESQTEVIAQPPQVA